MNHTALALLVGLLAGIAGGFVTQVVGSGSAGEPSRSAVDAGDGGADLGGRLARIEAALERMASGPLDVGGDPALQGSAPVRLVLDEASMAELQAATKETVKETLAEIRAEEAAGTLEQPAAPGRRARKRMKLADAAADFGLSAVEEEELRRIYQESMDKAYKLLAGEDGDIEQVRADIETARTDPSKRFALMGKYMPRVIPNIGEFMQIESDRRARVDEAIGKDRARELDRKYDIEEANPVPMGGRMRIETGMDGGRGLGR